MKLLLELVAILKHADETTSSARREEEASHIVSGTIQFLTTLWRAQAWTLFLCCACSLCDFSWNGSYFFPAKFNTDSMFQPQYHKRCVQGAISECCPGAGTRIRLGSSIPLVAQCTQHQQWYTLVVQQQNWSYLLSRMLLHFISIICVCLESSCLSFVNLSLIIVYEQI